MRILVALFLVIATSPVRADERPAWSRGVDESTQRRASELFEQANVLFAQQAHGSALAKYREAVALWAHPVIQFNMGITLLRMDRVLEAADAIDASLRFGGAPFTAEQHRQALDYQAMVRGRIGRVRVTCVEPHIDVLLDGKPWFRCPDANEQRVLVGEHTVLVEGAGIVPRTYRVTVRGGETAEVRAAPARFEDAVVTERRFAPWIPWSVLGVGLATGVTGWLVRRSGSEQLDRYDRRIQSECSTTGCDFTDPRFADLVELRTSGENRTTVGAILLIGGGTIAASGVVLLILNRPVVRGVRVNASVSDGRVDASVRWRF